MKQARMLGNYVEHLAKAKNISVPELGKILDCEEEKVNLFLKGRVFVAFEKIMQLADTLEVSVEELLAGNEEQYNATVVHCMHEFSDTNNREMILDIIDDYLDVLSAVNSNKN